MLTVEDVNLALDLNEQEQIYGLATENQLKTTQEKTLKEAASESINLGMRLNYS